MRWRHDDVIIVFTESVNKTCQWQPIELKLGNLIVHSKFNKICRFENHVTRNDVIMISLPKTIEKCGPRRNQTNYVSFERYWWELSKNVLFNEWVTMSKVMGIYVKFWHFLWCPLSKYGHVTWPKEQILKTFYLLLILH